MSKLIEKPSDQQKKKILFSMGGKGGVGKTAVMVALAEWLDFNAVPVSLLGCDIENETKGTLQQFFPDRCRKIDIRRPTGLDAFVEEAIDGDNPIVLADLGAGSGRDTEQWFNEMFDQIEGLDLNFVAIGAVTANPASVETVFTWARNLKKRVSYLIVRNLKDGEDIAAFDRCKVAKGSSSTMRIASLLRTRIGVPAAVDVIAAPFDPAICRPRPRAPRLSPSDAPTAVVRHSDRGARVRSWPHRHRASRTRCRDRHPMRAAPHRGKASVRARRVHRRRHSPALSSPSDPIHNLRKPRRAIHIQNQLFDVRWHAPVMAHARAPPVLVREQLSPRSVLHCSA